MVTTNKEQVRGKKFRKYGRKMRPVKHHMDQACGLRNCRKLLDSRTWSKGLNCYVAKEVHRESTKNTALR